MAKFSDVNTIVAQGAEAIFRFKAVLKNAGWVVKASSDGTTLNSSGDQITTSGTGAGGMNNNNAWFRIQEPGGLREWVVQRGTTELVWRVKYSALDRFTGGSQSATQTPSATDEQIMLGGGTDAAPTFATLFQTAGTYRAHIVAQSTAEGGAYGFWFFTTATGTGTPNMGFFQEPLIVSGYPPEDTDPVIVMVRSGTSSFGASNIGSQASAGGPKTWYKMNLSGEQFAGIGMAGPRSTNGAFWGATGGLANAFNAKDDVVPVCYGRTSSPVYFKGWSKYVFGKIVDRQYPATVDLATNALVYVDDCLVPWPESVTPII